MILPEKLRLAMEDDVTVARRFYELLFEQCPPAKQVFEGVNLREQYVMLQMALIAITQYPDLSKPTVSYLRVLGTRHQRAGVPKDLYSAFRDALVATMREICGDAWTDELQRQWEAAYEFASSLMFEGYDRNFNV